MKLVQIVAAFYTLVTAPVFLVQAVLAIRGASELPWMPFPRTPQETPVAALLIAMLWCLFFALYFLVAQRTFGTGSDKLFLAGIIAGVVLAVFYVCLETLFLNIWVPNRSSFESILWYGVPCAAGLIFGLLTCLVLESQ
jgi:hypothetical protein